MLIQVKIPGIKKQKIHLTIQKILQKLINHKAGDADSIDEEFTTESDNGENVKSTGKLATQEDLTDLE